MNHDVKVRVRFSETDMAGHVNNSSYFIYLEEARGRFFEDKVPETINSFGRFILASTKCNYVNQAYYGQTLKVSTWVSKIGNKSFHFAHSIHIEDTDELVAEADAVIVNFNYKEQKSEPISDELREVLEHHMATA
ncbi:acyl-CoA thioesterase [Halobacillus massiliensis]|uniref:acyl-CoA thioesterase n=1 Tax=Halobacillus massiliensis TaxID=1926286 RepID=UPI0015C4C406|nr:thioesterase family protein [Halobacillus massiliensis]